jgi:DNA-binding transcriptional regulator YdaS (Cro superfamily)
MSNVLSPLESLRTAVLSVGSQSATARLLGVTQAAVWGWLNRGTPLPAEHVLALEDASGVSKHSLRPDIYGAAPPATTTVVRQQSADLAGTARLIAQ